MFEKLSLKVIKEVINHYDLQTKIRMSKMVDDKRKKLTKIELAKELHKHLIINDDGEIRYKAKEEFNYPKVKFENDEKPKKKKVS